MSDVPKEYAYIQSIGTTYMFYGEILDIGIFVRWG